MRSNKSMSQTSLSLLLVTAFFAIFAIAGAGTAFAACSDPFDCFAAADGNQDSGPGDLTDWQDVKNQVTRATDPVKGIDTKFSGGDKEIAPGSWKFITGNNTPKTDILEGWSRLANNVLDVSFVRAKQNGDTFLAFELNQKPAITKADGYDYPQRSTGDILFTYDVLTTNKLNFGMCIWDGNSDSGDWNRLDGTPLGGPIKTCSKLPSSGPPPIAEGNVNWNNQITGYLDAPPFDPIAAGKFGEAAVDFGSTADLRNFLQNTMTNPCGPNGWFWMHSRASDSVISQPKDVLTGAPLASPECDFTIDKKVSLSGQQGTFVDADQTHALATTVGDSVTYQVTVTNTKSAPLTINVTDPLCDSGLSAPGGHTGQGDVLAPAGQTGDSITYACTHLVTGQESGNPFENTACADASAMLDNGTGTPVTASVGTKCDDAWVESFTRDQLAGAKGSKFIDMDNSGSSTDGDTPGSGFVFFVDYNGNGSLDAGEPAAASGDDGNWTISGIKPPSGGGTLPVLEVGRDGFTCTFPGQGAACHYDATFTGGSTTPVGAFGNAPAQLVAPEQVGPAPGQIVLGERITPGRARLLGPTGCQSRAFRARVRGTKVAKVVFTLDGHRIKTLTKKNFRGTYAVRINPRSLRIGVHRLIVQVSFQRGSGTKAKTFRLAFQRCPRALRAPRFTG